MKASSAAVISLCLLALKITGCNAGKKSKDQIQKILMNAVGSIGAKKEEPEPLVLPWKKPNTVMEYVDILTFPDESEITDNHICQCRLEGEPITFNDYSVPEYQNDAIEHSYEGAI